MKDNHYHEYDNDSEEGNDACKNNTIGTGGRVDALAAANVARAVESARAGETTMNNAGRADALEALNLKEKKKERRNKMFPGSKMFLPTLLQC